MSGQEPEQSGRSVVVLGASRDRGKFGNKSVRAHRQQGWEVYPVNPQADEIEGLRCYARLEDVPLARVDRVSVYLPPRVSLGMLEEIAAKQPGEVWFNPGSESAEVIARAQELGLNAIQACSIVDVGGLAED